MVAWPDRAKMINNATVHEALLTVPHVMMRRDITTGDATAEHLQVTMPASISLDNVGLIEFRGRDIVPEIDRDTLVLTFILDDDTELTSGYDTEGWYQVEGGNFTKVSSTGAANMSWGDVGNGAGESFNFTLRMMSLNGTQATKYYHIIVNYHFDNSTLDGIRIVELYGKITTAKRIKGFRIDTNNSGDMINSGTMELWASLSGFP